MLNLDQYNFEDNSAEKRHLVKAIHNHQHLKADIIRLKKAVDKLDPIKYENLIALMREQISNLISIQSSISDDSEYDLDDDFGRK